MGVRDERTQDLFLLDMNPVLPTEEGQVRLVGTDIKAYVGGAVVSLITGSGLTYAEFLLDNEPTAETGATDCTYIPAYTANKITKEEWKRNDTTLIKSIDYSYTSGKVTQEVRKVFAANGTTIVAQVTWAYSYTGMDLTSAAMTRDV